MWLLSGNLNKKNLAQLAILYMTEWGGVIIMELFNPHCQKSNES